MDIIIGYAIQERDPTATQRRRSYDGEVREIAILSNNFILLCVRLTTDDRRPTTMANCL